MFWTLADRASVLCDWKLDQKNCTIFLDHPEKACQKWPTVGKFAREGLLSAKLILTLEDFDLDYFGSGFSFVSEKLRDAMALGPSDIQYFDVDSSQSAPLPRSKNYRIMHVPVTDDVSDLKNSEYPCRHHPDGSLEIVSPIAPAFRDEAQPVHQIFADRSFKTVYCTDEFALRVLWAGCTGVRFFGSRPSGWPRKPFPYPARRRGGPRLGSGTKRSCSRQIDSGNSLKLSSLHVIADCNSEYQSL
jgi:hypothetical protein